MSLARFWSAGDVKVELKPSAGSLEQLKMLRNNLIMIGDIRLGIDTALGMKVIEKIDERYLISLSNIEKCINAIKKWVDTEKSTMPKECERFLTLIKDTEQSFNDYKKSLLPNRISTLPKDINIYTFLVKRSIGQYNMGTIDHSNDAHSSVLKKFKEEAEQQKSEENEKQNVKSPSLK